MREELYTLRRLCVRTIEDQIKEGDFKTLQKEIMEGSGYHRQLVLFYLLLEILKGQRHGM